VLGWHIQLFHTQLLVTPPAPSGARPGAYSWHQDNNRMNLDLETTPQPRVSVKVGYFLTDLPAVGMGNLAVVPGSHRHGRPEVASGDEPEEAVELTAAAGDAVLFDRRLWHSASTNCSSSTRIFVTFGYSYRWLRPKSEMRHDDLFDAVDPVRRQLLGWTSSANARFDPTDDDVPLRAWIAEHAGLDAVTA
jgi:ectoine hydroxylase-related dioxygenase (phytanoyl-CoA dioxygenase family)